MSTLKLLGPNGKPLQPERQDRNQRLIKSRYDAAITSDENARHWANADALSARAAHDPLVRQRLRMRARYEVANNSYAKGIVLTLANDCIGTGPRLQVQLPDEDLAARVTAAFEEWTCGVGLAEKLRTMRMSRAVDGEAFALLTTNPKLPTPVQLDLRLVEADQVAAPFTEPDTQALSDGIRFDEWGNPESYFVLKHHPGDVLGFSPIGAYDLVPASLMLHLFRADRPGQVRGVPEITPALPLFAQLRRYTLATVSAAEIAALFAALLKSTMPPDENTPTADPFDMQNLDRNMMVALPEGYDVTQLRAEQPTTTYPQFKAELLNEIARCLNMPFNVAAGNSSGYNYSSGRLDHQVYHRSIGVDRYCLETWTLDRLLATWLAEARLADPALVAGLPPGMPQHEWFWDGFSHVDPTKEADAQVTRLKAGTTTLADIWAEEGYDWRVKARQQAAERKFYEGLGLPYPGDSAPSPAPAPPQDTPPEADMSASAVARQRIAAEAAIPDRLTLNATAPVEITAAKGEGKRPTFDIVGYTGAVMSVGGFYTPVIVDLTGLKAASQAIPALRDHDTGRIVGQTDSVAIGAEGVRLSGTITGENADSVEVVSQSKNGFRWQASIGANIDRREFLDAGKKATVNGREVVGPIVIARQSTLYEISFVAIGADSQTSAAVAASNPNGTHQGSYSVDFNAWLAAKGFDPAALNDDARTSLKAWYDADQRNAGAPQQQQATTVQPQPQQQQERLAAAAPATQTIAEIIAAQRAEDKRVEEITRITAEAIRERPGMLDTLERMAKAAIEARSTTVQQFELEILRLRASAPAAGFSIHTAGSVKATGKVIEAALCRAGGLDDAEKHFDERTLEACHDRFPHGLGLCDTLSIAARENGWSGHSVKGDIGGVLRAAFPAHLGIRAQGWTTLTLPNILGAVYNKFLSAGFNSVESTWRAIASRRNVADFKAINTYALTGGFTFEKVGPGGELKHASAGELAYTNQIATYGRMMAVTRQDIINDDLGALTQIPRKLGRGGALALNRDFWTVFLNNSSFFTSGRLNYSSGSGTVLSLASLDTANTLFLNQTDPDGDPVAVTPKILLVPNAIKVAAMNFMNSTTVVNNTTANTTTLGNNAFAGLYDVVSSSYLSNSALTGYSTTAWYLLADPNDMPVIQVAFLNGREVPTVEDAEADFNTLGIQFRGYMDYGIALQEYRGGVKLAGA